MANPDAPDFSDVMDDAATAADTELKDKQVELLARTAINLNVLRPRIGDKASFDALIAAVNESTRRNESIAQLKQRITDLGKGALAVAKEAAAIAAKV